MWSGTAIGILDKYHYTYDAAGNKTRIQKQRRNLPEESGSYRYTYDALQRLTEVEKDGDILRSYHYDSFGNRTSMEDYEQGISSMFTYDALNRLTNEKNCYNSDKAGDKREATASVYYDYDKRGNMIGEYREGNLSRRYVYNAMNRLEKVCNKEGQGGSLLLQWPGISDGKNLQC